MTYKKFLDSIISIIITRAINITITHADWLTEWGTGERGNLNLSMEERLECGRALACNKSKVYLTFLL